MSDFAAPPPFIINAETALRQAGEAFAFSFAQDPISDEQSERFPSDVVLSRVKVDGVYCATDETVVVSASVSAHVKAQCARCLSDVRFQMTADIRESFARTPKPDDEDVIVFSGNAIDITESVCSALLLALPMRSLCRHDCRGLCPVCGVNLNEKSCSCDCDVAVQARGYWSIKTDL
jgi:uncharacterized protein